MTEISSWVEAIASVLLAFGVAFLFRAPATQKPDAAAELIASLEADVDRPLSTVVRQAEMVAEEEHRQRHGLPMVTDFSSCINCGRTAIYVAGRAEPVAWVQTDPCRLHPRR